MRMTFQAITAATEQAHEPAQLMWANQHLVAVLVPADGGWFLEHGFGPCASEALLFETLDDAAGWAKNCMTAAPTTAEAAAG
jgi:hypothetical protein